MRIGKVKLDNNLFLAPMAGITDRTFRFLCKEQGCALVYTEMVSAKGLYYGNRRTEDLIYVQPADRPVAVQIFGSDPGLMAEVAARLCSGGADMIDINMGCPTPKIVKNGEGAALMLKPRLAAEIVGRVSSAVKVPVTVKIRKGWDENTVNAVEVGRLAEENGASAIAIHGRTREQFYTGRADWDIIREMKEGLGIPVIGNGDVYTPADAVDMLVKTGCDAVMIARGAMGNPWIFSRTLRYMETGEAIGPPDFSEVAAMIKRHACMLIEHKGERTGVREMRKHIGWYVKGVEKACSLRKEINSAETKEQLLRILGNYMDENGEHL